MTTCPHCKSDCVQLRHKGRKADRKLSHGGSDLDRRGHYVNNVLMGKLLESDLLMQKAANNSKEQFANSPDLSSELMNAIMDAFEAHSTMSKQAIDSDKVRQGLKHILLGPAELYEALRSKWTSRQASKSAQRARVSQLS